MYSVDDRREAPEFSASTACTFEMTPMAMEPPSRSDLSVVAVAEVLKNAIKTSSKWAFIML